MGDLGATIAELLQAQWYLQRNSFDTDPVGLNGKDRSDYVLWNSYALEDEIHEATNEISWKPWATGSTFNREEYLGELADAFHFLMNLVLAAGPSERFRETNLTADEHVAQIAAEFVARYHRKRQVNASRQLAGYDGFTDKCACGRAIEDGHQLEEYRPNHRITYRCVCGNLNHVTTAHTFHPDDNRCIDCGRSLEEMT